ELSYAARRVELGNALGVNLRQAPYSGVDDTWVGVIRTALASAAGRHQAPLVPLPISVRGPSDLESIAKLIEPMPAAQAITLQQVLQQVSRCRVVVTGSYHAAVFALAQGISVVGVTQSTHYQTKLGGLAHQFGDRCTL